MRLETGVTYPFAAVATQARDSTSTRDHYNERRRSFPCVASGKDREKRERAADHATNDSQSSFIERCPSALQSDEGAGDERRMDSRPIDRLVNDVAEHRGEGDLEGEVHVRGIGKRVGHQETFRFRPCGGLRCVRQTNTASSARRSPRWRRPAPPKATEVREPIVPVKELLRRRTAKQRRQSREGIQAARITRTRDNHIPRNSAIAIPGTRSSG